MKLEVFFLSALFALSAAYAAPSNIDDLARQLEPAAKEFVDLTTSATQHENDINGKNVASDYAWVAARALANFAAYTIYLTQAENVDIERASAMGITGATLSALFQFFTPQYVRFVTHRGIFNLSKTVAPFWETQMKEYALQWVYIGIFHLVAYGLGLESNLITHELLMTVFMSWLVEGSWSVLIAKSTQHLKEHQFKSRPRLAWHLSKASFFGLSLLSSVLMISGLHGDTATKIAYPVMAVSGLATYAWVFERERLRRGASYCAKGLSVLLKGRRR